MKTTALKIDPAQEFWEIACAIDSHHCSQKKCVPKKIRKFVKEYFGSDFVSLHVTYGR